LYLDEYFPPCGKTPVIRSHPSTLMWSHNQWSTREVGSFLATSVHRSFPLPYSCHVFGLEFVLDTDGLRFISVCPRCVLVVPLGQTQNGFGTDTGSRSFHLLNIISTLFTLFLITGPLFPPIVLGLRVGHGDTWYFNKKPKPGHRSVAGPRSRSTCWSHRRPPRTGVFRSKVHRRPPRTGFLGGVTHRRPPRTGVLGGFRK
jgi:hypothetical protein